jgi:lipopolysaccharide biosynthesis protein
MNISASVPVPNPKLIAFFLPQYHPTPENDEWWGKGFTEWTNVTKAAPLFDGHYQPHLPADLGFYDLRLKETRHEQIKLARQYGIDGFCYHYYWFSGKRILSRPVDDMYADDECDMPYCFCWANENWTRRWDAAEQDVLIAQKYLPDDDLIFIKDMVKYFKDPRYIKVDGAPFLIVYRPQHLIDAAKTLRAWRDYCKGVGIDKIHLCAALVHGNDDYVQYGFDSGVQFPPHNPMLAVVNDKIAFLKPHKGYVMDYCDLVSSYLNREYVSPNVYYTVTPAWDNTARTNDRAYILINSSPGNYEYWLAGAINKTRADHQQQDRMVFINAWNEWAEGCHLEPDKKYGHQFLESTLNAKLHPDIQRRLSEILSPAIYSSQSFFTDIKSVFAAHTFAGLSLWKRRLAQFPALNAFVRKIWGNYSKLLLF